MNNRPPQEDPRNIDALCERIRRRGRKRVSIGLTDIDGRMLGKYVSLDKFESIARHGGSWCDCIFGWDIEDAQNDHFPGMCGSQPGYPDAPYRLDLSTFRLLPDEKDTPLFLAEFHGRTPDEYHPVCPRSVLRRVIDRASAQGFEAVMAFEYEFFLFQETSSSIRQKRYQNLTPHTEGNCGYSMLRSATCSDLLHPFMDYCLAIDTPLEALHNETGPGVLEACIACDHAMPAADRAALFKTFSKVFFHKRGLMPTFMAKWNLDLSGQGGHIHQSLRHAETGQPLFHDPGHPSRMSDLMRHFVAGQLQLLRPLTAIFAPTVNSYRRLISGSWAPTTATWGVENRTVAVRAIISDHAGSQRLEHRVPGSDTNPYLAMAAALASGLYGIENKLEPPEPRQDNVYLTQDRIPEDDRLPGTLGEAVDLFEACEPARSFFGKHFVQHFAATRRWEQNQYERFGEPPPQKNAAPGGRTPGFWEMNRYFESV